MANMLLMLCTHKKHNSGEGAWSLIEFEDFLLFTMHDSVKVFGSGLQ